MKRGDELDKPVGLEGAELGGGVQFTNDRRIVTPNMLSQHIANQGNGVKYICRQVIYRIVAYFTDLQIYVH